MCHLSLRRPSTLLEVSLQGGRLTDSQPGQFKNKARNLRLIRQAARFRFLGRLLQASSRRSNAAKNSSISTYMGLDLKHAVFNQGSGHEKRNTLGARVWGERGPWAYDARSDVSVR